MTVQIINGVPVDISRPSQSSSSKTKDRVFNIPLECCKKKEKEKWSPPGSLKYRRGR